MSSKIADMKNVINEQNQMILTLRRDKMQEREILTSLYGGVVKYKHTHTSEATVVETIGGYPDVRHEDLANLSAAETMKRVGHAFKAIIQSLGESRSEIRNIYKELDQEVGDAMDSWNAIKAQDDSEKKKMAFREDLFSKNQTSRSSTPELSTPPRSIGGDRNGTGEITPDSANKGRAGPNEASKSKIGTTTVEGMFGSQPSSPTAVKTPNNRAPVKNGKV